MKSKLTIIVVVLVGIAALWLFVYRGRKGDTLVYHGERIKLSRSYVDFSTYKNNPNNIDATETARVQRLVRSREQILTN